MRITVVTWGPAMFLSIKTLPHQGNVTVVQGLRNFTIILDLLKISMKYLLFTKFSTSSHAVIFLWSYTSCVHVYL